MEKVLVIKRDGFATHEGTEAKCEAVFDGAVKAMDTIPAQAIGAVVAVFWFDKTGELCARYPERNLNEI